MEREMEREMERWRDGEMERWRDGESAEDIMLYVVVSCCSRVFRCCDVCVNK